MEEVVTHPLGLEKIVGVFEEATLKESQEDLQIVGIVGPGGCGKTTLAKELYARKCPMMKRSSFLSQVRSTAAENTLINLQKTLLRDMLADSHVKDLPFCSIDDGKKIVASHLRSVRVLLVLDDVDHVDQLDALLPGKENLARGSLIIVTTRQTNLLTSRGITSICQMEGLDPLHAEQLLCRHAFRRSSPPNRFKRSVEMLASFCGGLPLTLKILGGQLFEKPCGHWHSLEKKGSKFKKASRLLSNGIKEWLQISFDALDEDEQEIFLDIACFFTGEQKSLAIAVWDGLGWNGMHSWDMLVKKCLVELDEKKRIRMHDELRDFGKELAISRSPCRLWSPEQIVNIKKQDKMAIRGITAATSQFVVCSAHKEFPTCSDSYPPPFKDCMELIEKSSRLLKPLYVSSDGDESDLLCPSSEDESEHHFLNRSPNLLAASSDEDESELHYSSRSLKSLSPSSNMNPLFDPHIRKKTHEKIMEIIEASF